MNVLFLSAWWPTRVFPTHGNFVEKHARVVARRHQLTVVAVQEDYELPLGTREIMETVREGFREIIVYFGKRDAQGQFGRLKARFLAYRRGIKLAERLDGRPDVVHANLLLDAGVIAGLYALESRVPFVVSEHASRYTQARPLPILRSVLAKWACRRAALVLPVSAQLADSMQSKHHLRGNYRVVSNVVDTSLFRPALSKPPDSRMRLLHVSNFREETKNITGLLRSYRRLSERHPHRYRLTLAGDGDLEEVRERISSVGLTDAEVNVSGPHSEAEVARLMQTHDVFVLFSHRETQGVVLLEAMAVGLPCIASGIGDDLIVDGLNGYRVEAANEDQLVSALERMHTAYPDFSPVAIRDTAVKRYGEHRVLQQLEEVYNAALID
ncbi:glycosyltransferase [Lewinella sp. IMCC34183]|uniref:glycosyltransferase n=1 Tax=Lewinella sp. IMCC34183 TaxID=2248762 RepID=UPI000E254CFD|nr:glycosyltransferase [Lewinella sp. IMCC34183]